MKWLKENIFLVPCTSERLSISIALKIIINTNELFYTRLKKSSRKKFKITNINSINFKNDILHNASRLKVKISTKSIFCIFFIRYYKIQHKIFEISKSKSF